MDKEEPQSTSSILKNQWPRIWQTPNLETNRSKIHDSLFVNNPMWVITWIFTADKTKKWTRHQIFAWPLQPNRPWLPWIPWCRWVNTLIFYVGSIFSVGFFNSENVLAFKDSSTINMKNEVPSFSGFSSNIFFLKINGNLLKLKVPYSPLFPSFHGFFSVCLGFLRLWTCW